LTVSDTTVFLHTNENDVQNNHATKDVTQFNGICKAMVDTRRHLSQLHAFGNVLGGSSPIAYHSITYFINN
jgi:hypothetical protein